VTPFEYTELKRMAHKLVIYRAIPDAKVATITRHALKKFILDFQQFEQRLTKEQEEQQRLADEKIRKETLESFRFEQQKRTSSQQDLR